jgi:hypothetical protein
MIRLVLIRIMLPVALALLFGASVPGRDAAAPAKKTPPKDETVKTMNEIAESYVKLALAVGQHDPLYVDAYFGPESWRTKAKAENKPLALIEREAVPLVARLEKLDVSKEEEIARLRRQFLVKQLESLIARTRLLQGVKLSFDDESNALFDVTAPHHDDAYFKAKLGRIDSILPPGEGTLAQRYERFRKDFIIPKEKVDAVFTAAIAEARKRTRAHLALPDSESFSVEYVTGKSWGAYNWYKGRYRSVIQVNTELPVYIDSPIGLACHEGYPGHHIQNVLSEENLVNKRGWIEFTVSPLFGPLSPINEGSANFAIEVAFPGDERIAFERDVLYPLAGIDPSKAASYGAVQKLVRELNYAENEAGRRYLNGEISADSAAHYHAAYALMTNERAKRLVTFMDEYRSYIVNYNVGYDLVKHWVDKMGGTPDHPEKRWEQYTRLISAPWVPSELR